MEEACSLTLHTVFNADACVTGITIQRSRALCIIEMIAMEWQSADSATYETNRLNCFQRISTWHGEPSMEVGLCLAHLPGISVSAENLNANNIVEISSCFTISATSKHFCVTQLLNIRLCHF